MHTCQFSAGMSSERTPVVAKKRALRVLFSVSGCADHVFEIPRVDTCGSVASMYAMRLVLGRPGSVRKTETSVV